MYKISLFFLLSLILTACGGGGGGGSAPTNPNTVFQLFSSNEFVVGNTTQTTYTGSDSAGGKYTGTFSEKTQAQTTF